MKVTLTFTDKSDIARQGVKLAALDGLFIAADETVGYIKQGLLRGPKTGRVYIKKNPNRTHVASKAGEYPATDTSLLHNSLGTERDFDGVYIVSASKYAKELEFRAPQKGGRPFITRGVIEQQDRIAEIVSAYTKRHLNG